MHRLLLRVTTTQQDIEHGVMCTYLLLMGTTRMKTKPKKPKGKPKPKPKPGY